MRRLLDGDAVAIGRALEIPARTLRSYEERGENGRRGPGKLLALLIHEALRCGREYDDALAPLRALADEFELDLAPRVVADEEPADVGCHCVALMAEVGDVARATYGATKDGVLTPDEATTIEREGHQVIALVHQIIGKAHANVGQPRRIGVSG